MDRFYFDHNATTPVAPEVLDVYLPLVRDVYGNASSIHQFGQAARQRLEQARRQVAALLGCNNKEIVFTSGGTEADNLAIFGAVRASGKSRKHVVTSAIEHPAVLQACRQLEREGTAVTYVEPTADGVIEAEAVRRAMRPETALVSVMHANNEIGTVQPVAEIAAVAHESGALMHSDGVQAVGKLPVDVAALGVDLYSLSAHKLYAPKGTGALFVRQGVTLEPLQYGGRHEQGRRAGTENVAGAVALGAAAELAGQQDKRVEELCDWLETEVLARIPDVTVNGGRAPRVPNTANFCFRGIEGEALVIALDLRGFAVSSGSACSSGAVEPSHVLLALGLSREDARSSVRISLGRSNTREQVERLADALVSAVAHLRRLSPGYHPIPVGAAHE